MKVAVVGGGTTYTPELVEGFGWRARRPPVCVTELVLDDPATDRLAVVGVSAANPGAAGAPGPARAGRPRWTTGRRGGRRPAPAAGGRAGGAAGDETLAASSAAGPGDDRRRAVSPRRCVRCRWCWTSPSGSGAGRARRVDRRLHQPGRIVTRALLDEGHRALGLCNVAIGFQRRLATQSASPPTGCGSSTSASTTCRGSAVLVDGEDRLPGLLAVPRWKSSPSDVELPAELIRRARRDPVVLPALLLLHRQRVDEQRHRATRAQEVLAIERELLEMYADPTLDHKPELLRSAAVPTTARPPRPGGLADRRPAPPLRQRAQQRHDAGLPDDAVVEVPAVVDARTALRRSRSRRSARYCGLSPTSSGVRGTGHRRGAVDGGRDRVLRALLAHPLVGQWGPGRAPADRLIADNANTRPGLGHERRRACGAVGWRVTARPTWPWSPSDGHSAPATRRGPGSCPPLTWDGSAAG